jgi:hypothetical protein
MNNFNITAAMASVVFWTCLAVVSLMLPFRRAVSLAFSSVRRSKLFLALVPGYLAVHLVIYGVLLEAILTGIYGGVSAYTAAGLYITGGFALFPHTLSSVAVSLTLSPSIELLIPPQFGASISMFALYTGVVIDLLVISNIAAFLKIRQRAKKVMGSVAVPLIGVTLGASCCLSVPELLAIASPSLSGLLFTPLGLVAQNAIYYLLPLLVIGLLALNFQSISKIILFPMEKNQRPLV